MDNNKNALNLIISLGKSYGSYHHHKELMAFRIVIIYLLGATALVIQGELFWRKFYNSFEFFVVAIAIILSAVGAFKYVRWQLKNRQIAADLVVACTNLATHLLANPESDKEEMEPTSLKGEDWIRPESQLPKALVDAYEKTRDKKKYSGNPIVSEKLTYGFMGLWTLAAAIPLWKNFISRIC